MSSPPTSSPPPPATPDPDDISQTNLIGLGQQFALAVIIVAVSLTAFEWLRRRRRSIYSPKPKFIRDYKIAQPPKGLFAWLWPLIKGRSGDDMAMDVYLGTDAAFWVLTLRAVMKFFAFCVVVTLVLVLPANINGGNGLSDLEAWSMSNVSKQNALLWCHLVAMILVVSGGCWMVLDLHKRYTTLRQVFLLRTIDRPHAENNRVARTVMVQNIPRQLQDEQRLKEYFERLRVGDVEEVVVVRDVKPLDVKLAERDRELRAVEAAYQQFLTTIQMKHEELCRKVMGDRLVTVNNDGNGGDALEEMSVEGFVKFLVAHPDALSRLSATDIPHERSAGKEFNALDVHSTKLELLDHKIQHLRQAAANYFDAMGAGFVTFSSVKSALLVSQLVLNADPRRLNCSRAPEPDELLWRNLPVTYNIKSFRKRVVFAVSVALIILWFIPLSFILSLISLQELSRLIPALGEFANRSQAVQSFITNVLPTILTSVLMSLLPGILYALTLFESPVTVQEVERRTAVKYYFFLVVNVFLFVTLGSTFLFSIRAIINNPSLAIPILGTVLPSAATFFINYVVLYLSAPVLELLQIPKLLFDVLVKRWFITTPRNMAEAFKPTPASYYVWVPTAMLMFTISLCYSIISPIITLFAMAAFAVSYLGHKYQLMYVYVNAYDSGAAFWPVILDQMYVGFVLFQLTMIGIFLLKEAFLQAIFVIPLMYMVYRVRAYCKEVVRHSGQHLPVDQLEQSVITPSVPSNPSANLLGLPTLNRSMVSRSDEDLRESEEDIKGWYFNQPSSTSYHAPAQSKPLEDVWFPKELAAWRGVRFDWSLVYRSLATLDAQQQPSTASQEAIHV